MLSPAASCLARRTVLAGLGAVGVAPIAASRAAVTGLVVQGRDGWLFSIFDDVRRTNVARLQRTVQNFNEAIGTLKAAGIETVLAVMPAKARVYREFLPDDVQFTAEGESRYPAALDALRRPGTLVPDLATLLADARKAQPGQVLFFKTDTHWTPAGAEIAAIEIANQIKQKLNLPTSPAPGVQFSQFTNNMQQRGDLGEQLSPDPKRYPPEPFAVRQVMGAQGQTLLIEDDNADVAVVGNSYTHPRWGMAAMLSNQLGRPVALEWKVFQFSPHRTLLSYLGGEAFRRRRPKLIVWTILEKDTQTLIDDRGTWKQNAMTQQAFIADIRRAVGA